MKLKLSNFKFLRSWAFLVFAFLVIFRVGLWFSVDWQEDVGGQGLNNIVKVQNLPVYFMVLWPDSGRYWTYTDNKQFSAYYLTYKFFSFVKVISDSVSFAVLSQNLLGLITAWLLFIMLRYRGSTFAAIVIFIAFANLFTISMEYAILREVLARFFLILSVYLFWRMSIVPSWGRAIVAGISFFLLGWIRQELMIIPIVLVPLVFWRFPKKYVLVFVTVGLLGIYTLSTVGSGISMYSQLLDNLLLESYNYNSPDLGKLPKKIYAKAEECKKLYKTNCQLPSVRYGMFRIGLNNVLSEWRAKNKNNPKSKAEVIFVDIFKHNTRYIIYSAGYSFWSYMTGNLFTISPLIYSGDNSYYKEAWLYYASPSVTKFFDPRSEISYRDRGSRLLLAIMSPFSEYWFRKILAPFFFVGLFCVGRMVFLKEKSISSLGMTFWLLAAIISVTILFVSCFVGVRGSRRIFSIDPFICAISVLGMEELKRRVPSFLSTVKKRWFVSSK
ncbi:MAG: hypothetical protein U9Q21_00460 [Candidatus Auribacterota bacterium]|nr:hypothetical protein [Candidatus Auribacterota bacterium]